MAEEQSAPFCCLARARYAVAAAAWALLAKLDWAKFFCTDSNCVMASLYLLWLASCAPYWKRACASISCALLWQAPSHPEPLAYVPKKEMASLYGTSDEPAFTQLV